MRPFLARLGLLALLLAAGPVAAAEDAGLLALPRQLPEPPAERPAAPARPDPPPPAAETGPGQNVRQKMRDVVRELSAYARQRRPGFVLIARGGDELLVKGEREQRWEALRQATSAVAVGAVVPSYAGALDGVLRDGLYCRGGKPQPAAERQRLLARLRGAGLAVLAVDGCGDQDSRAKAAAEGVPLMTAITAPRPPQENAEHVTTLAKARNLLVAAEAQPTRAEWLARLARSNYDVLVVAVFPDRGGALTRDEVALLRYKGLGSRRLVLAAMPLGSAAELSFFWRPDWRQGHPPWLGEPLAGRRGVHAVDYRDPAWQRILGQYLVGIMDLGFDGVVFEDVDAHRRLEQSLAEPAKPSAGSTPAGQPRN